MQYFKWKCEYYTISNCIFCVFNETQFCDFYWIVRLDNEVPKRVNNYTKSWVKAFFKNRKNIKS